MNSELIDNPQQVLEPLQSDLWQKANQQLLRKMLREFIHERLIEPQCVDYGDLWNYYQFSPIEGIDYFFKAKVLVLNHWWIDENSIKKMINHTSVALESVRFIIECRSLLMISSDLLPTYLEEINSTLYSSLFKLNQSLVSAKQLVFSDYQTIESSMTEGHPSFVANNGRIGFTATDFYQYTPESAQKIHLYWLAVKKNRAIFSLSSTLTAQKLYEEELGVEFQTFIQVMNKKGLDINEYVLIPVHPWQWNNKLLYLYASDLAMNQLVFLGEGKDAYQAQQSIRTFFNLDHSNKCYVKTALSILNMGFMRGLSPYYMEHTPAINDWIYQKVNNDAVLSSCGFRILREVAAVGYNNVDMEEATTQGNPYRKMLSALWRESPITKITPQQNLMTMASLLHIDRNNQSVLVELIKQSDKTIEQWLQCYFQCYLMPLVHCFYAHDLAFMPHGENLILIMENFVPVGVFMKDIGEEVVILNKDAKLPESVQRIVVDIPDSQKTLAIFTDVFVGVFRYLSPLLLEHCQFSEHLFWQEVVKCLRDYQSKNPQLADKFMQFDLFVPEFEHSCLNRLQIRNNQQMVDLSDPASSTQIAGVLKNPLVSECVDC